MNSLIVSVISLLLLFFGSAGVVLAYDNGATNGLPPRGWNSWCSDVQCGVDVCFEWNIKEIALAMNENGMKAAGYNLIQLDDCWAATIRTASGEMMWNASRFPSGIPSLADWLHQRGFRFGLYTSLGDEACHNHRLGSFGHYQQDADTFAKWKIDRVKIDYCGGNLNRTADGPYYQHKQFADAFNKTSRPIEQFLCRGYGAHGPPHPFPSWLQTLSSGARASGDHHDVWSNSAGVIEALAEAAQDSAGKFAGFAPHTAKGTLENEYFYLSNDMMYTGGAGCPAGSQNTSAHCPGQTDDQYISFFSISALVSSDLIVSTDVRYMTAVMQKVLLNDEVLSIQQDRSVIGTRLTRNAAGCTSSGACQIWTRTLADGSVAVILFNADETSTQTFGVSLNVLFPNAQKGQIVIPRDLWKHADEDPRKIDGGSIAAFSLPPTSVKVYRIRFYTPW